MFGLVAMHAMSYGKLPKQQLKYSELLVLALMLY